MSIFDLFKKGNEVANPAEVKSVQINSNNVAAIASGALSVAALYGYDFGIDKETVISATSGIFSIGMIVNSVMTVISSKRAGL